MNETAILAEINRLERNFKNYQFAQRVLIENGADYLAGRIRQHAIKARHKIGKLKSELTMLDNA